MAYQGYSSSKNSQQQSVANNNMKPNIEEVENYANQYAEEMAPGRHREPPPAYNAQKPMLKAWKAMRQMAIVELIAGW